VPFGVDEAGKGPVLGSMFAAAVRADPADLPAGVGDSKGIPPARRTELDAVIREAADAVAVAEIPVARIDDPETDMNTLTVAAHAEAAAGLVDGTTDGHLAGTVDAGDTDAERFGRRVAERVTATTGTEVTVEAAHGADESDPLVGAASIVAKVARDSHVDALAEQYGDCVSGYPSDPTTRGFLADYVAEYGALPDCARASWATCEDVLAAAEQSTLGEF
jgi:ribonuclease HII